uniref:MAT homeobox alpha 2 protein n=1 Tax=Suhomyces bokatorum TaxID=246048 RepID=A0A3Q9FBH6_9ASCO|nr:MAT homeobox alpha 2 protein [Suhomyces bokatorum]AZQ56712.1 MAT homeobox alpha 2 protein [Suhomyces bokatorum]AZQ56718.1 MAT homeobox alpha 2 protein [Suhomyces bokatorum]AZQ56731.1 MAT homeobox alpha 2 protein [Suhomyces bokatorum]AZQ56737.1 MAT homeobox alpha 2 protein [Suhomyces bokatorum]
MTNLLEFLNYTESNLKISSEKAKTYPNIDWEEIRLQIEGVFENLENYLFNKVLLDEEENQTLQQILSLVALIKYVCEERLHQIQAYKVSVDEFNFDFKNPKGNRFSNEQVQIMAEWYNVNIEHPYLNTSSMEDLRIRTGLTRVQVRDWMSYKRRKQKSKFISNELESYFTNN